MTEFINGGGGGGGGGWILNGMALICNLVRLEHQAIKRFVKLYSKMPPTKRHFRLIETVEQVRKLLDQRWKIGRVNKDASLENVQSLHTNIVHMRVESLNLWFAKFVQEVCKPNGDRYPP